MSSIKLMMNIKAASFKKNEEVLFDIINLITLNVPICQLPYELWHHYQKIKE